LVEFGGWEMPLSYGEGTIAEHRACRRHAVVFDVSHLGTVRVSGTGAFDRLQGALSNDLRKVAPGRAQYTHLLDEEDASVVDDIIVWWLSDDVFDVMPNASNTDHVVAAIGGEDTTAPLPGSPSLHLHGRASSA
jgi:aminomethyltransferase